MSTIRSTAFCLMSTLLLCVGSEAQVGLGQSSAIEADDREILDLVFEQIRLRAGSPTLHVSRKESDPIAVLDHTRPVCRQKVNPYEMNWPLFCAPDPLRFLKNRTIAQLPDWIRSAALDETGRSELIGSFEERNQSWRPLPPVSGKSARMWSRQRYFDLEFGPDDLIVFSLPGYSTTGHAIVYADFSCGSTCGTTYMVALQRTDSSWKIVSRVIGLEIR